METLEHGCIGQLLLSRTAAWSKLSKEVEELNKRDKKIKELLISSAPENLKVWLIEDCIVDNLFEYGKSSRKIYFYEDEYDFKEMNDIKDKIKNLSEKWEGVVSIKIEDPEQHRVEIKFVVIF
jgi:hypothetical protein